MMVMGKTMRKHYVVSKYSWVSVILHSRLSDPTNHRLAIFRKKIPLEDVFPPHYSPTIQYNFLQHLHDIRYYM